MMRIWLLLSLVLLAPSTMAHKLAPSLLQIEETAPLSYQVLWRTPQLSTGTPPEPSFPDACKLDEPAMQAAGTAFEWRWQMHCEGGLAGQTLEVVGLYPNRTAALVRIALLNGGEYQQLLDAGGSRYTVPAGSDAGSVVLQYLGLGVEHILIGADHLLFVLGLLLLARSWRELLATVTSFTVGHSITLALVALGMIPQWSSLVELAIAASILVLAVELAARPGTRARLQRRQWALAGAFGLVHGLGFAGVLAELGLPAGDILAALLAFNVGIELGQITFVVAAVLVLALSRRGGDRIYRGLRWGAVYLMGTMSTYWCIARGGALIAGIVYS